MKKARCVRLIASLLSLSGIAGAQATTSNPSPASLRAADGAALLRKFVIAPSSSLRFLTSETGKKIAAGFPPLAGYLAGMGINIRPADDPTADSPAQPNPAVILQPNNFEANAPCDAPGGALFNLEPATGSPEIHLPVPQLANSVDYIPGGGVLGADLVIAAGDDYRGVFDQIRNGGGAGLHQFRNAWGFTMSGYYVHRAGPDCSPSFEGALPHIPYHPTGDVLYGYDPAVAVDSTRGLAYAVDVRFAATVNGLGLFGTTVSRLNDAKRCADGTHLTDDNGLDTAAAMCWPMARPLNLQRNIGQSTFSATPHLAVDLRSAGVGAGDVYVSWTNFDDSHGIADIQLIACQQNFTARKSCSEPLTISGGDPHTQYSRIAVRPDGVVSITYASINLIETDTPPYERQTFDIMHVSCVPNGAGSAPTCKQPTLVASEGQPIPFFSGPGPTPFDFPPATLPVHDHRVNGNNTEEFVAWSRCKVDPYFWVGVVPFLHCVDSDVVFTWSVTDSAGVPLGWAPPILADARKRDQLMPSLKTDSSRNTMELVYLSASKDSYNERYLVVRREITPGSYVPGSLATLTSVPIEPSADAFLPLFIGDIMGLSVGAGHAYVSFTSDAYDGIVHKTSIPGNNNLLRMFSY
jgi:hypothetical protein